MTLGQDIAEGSPGAPGPPPAAVDHPEDVIEVMDALGECRPSALVYRPADEFRERLPSHRRCLLQALLEIVVQP